MVAKAKADPPVKMATKRVPSLGVQIDSLFKLREELRAIQAKETAKKEEIGAAEVVLMETMKREGVDKSTGKLATASVSDIATPNVTDWDALWAYIFKTKQTHLLQRRVSADPIRELFEKKGMVPGVEIYTKRNLNLRKVS